MDFYTKMKSNVVLQPSGNGRLFPDTNNNEGTNSKKKSNSYGLRPRAGKGESSKRRQGSKNQGGAAPLSKYRRRTANARERTRMREINCAFEALRRCIGGIDGAESVGGERMTKISTLRLAAQYIASLAAALAEPVPSQPSLSSPDFSCYSDLSASLSPDFQDAPFSPDFPDAPLTPDFTSERSLSPFEQFFSEFS